MNPDGSGVVTRKPTWKGEPLMLNDLVFDKNGNLYFTDFRGTPFNPIGGVYRVDASDDYMTIHQITAGIAGGNGISFAPKGNTLWVAESFGNRVFRIDLAPDGVTIPIGGTNIAYRTVGDPGGCDSNRMDSAGNLYQAFIFQGRLAVLTRTRFPWQTWSSPIGRKESTSSRPISPSGRARAPDISWGREKAAHGFSRSLPWRREYLFIRSSSAVPGEKPRRPRQFVMSVPKTGNRGPKPYTVAVTAFLPDEHLGEVGSKQVARGGGGVRSIRPGVEVDSCLYFLHFPIDPLSHVDPSVHFAPSKIAPDKFAPDKFAPDKFAPARYAPPKIAPDKFAPDKFAPSRYALFKRASCRPAPDRSASCRLAKLRFAPDRSHF